MRKLKVDNTTPSLRRNMCEKMKLGRSYEIKTNIKDSQREFNKLK